MGERAKVSIFADAAFIRVAFTKLGLVHFRVVELFDGVVSEGARISKRANLLFGPVHVCAKITSVGTKFATPILCLVVEKGTPFQIVV